MPLSVKTAAAPRCTMPESTEMVKEADAAQTTYIVKKGDTIMSICKKYYGNTEKLNEIIAVNNIEDADKLYIGQEIKLP